MSSASTPTFDLGPRLSARRLELELTQKQVAELLGVSVRTLQDWEAGKSFPWPRYRAAIREFFANGASS